jgi:hypothetical protein
MLVDCFYSIIISKYIEKNNGPKLAWELVINFVHFENHEIKKKGGKKRLPLRKT